MADLNITLGFDVEAQSIRNVQAEIRRTLKDTTPEIDLVVTRNAFSNIQAEIERRRYSINDLTADPRALEALRSVISDNISVNINDISLSDRGRRAVDKIKSDIQDSLAKLDVAIRLEQEAERSASGRPLSNFPGGPSAGARQLGLDPTGEIEELTKQREAVQRKLIQQETQLALVEKEFFEAVGEDTKAFRAMSARARKNVDALGKLAAITVPVEAGLKDVLRAIEKAKKIEGIGEGALPDPATGAERDPAGGKLVANARRELVANLERQAEVIRADVAAEELVIQAEKEKAAADKENSKALDALTKINRDIGRTGTNLIRARDRAASTIGVDEGTGQGKAVAEARLKLVDTLDQIIAIESESASVARLQQNAQKQAAASSKRFGDEIRRRANLERQVANELKEEEAALKRARDATNKVSDAATKNASAFRKLQSIVQRTFTSSKDFDKATRDLAALRNSVVRGSADAAGIAKRFDVTLENVIAKLTSRGEAAKIAEDAERNWIDAVIKSTAEVDKNASGISRLNSISSQFDRGLTQATSAIKQVEAIKSIGDGAGLSAELDKIKAALLARLTAEKKNADDAKEFERVASENERKLRDIGKTLDAENRELRQKLNLSKKTKAANENILKQLENEAKIVIQGQTELKKSFSFVTSKIKNSFKRILGQQTAPVKRGVSGDSTVTFRGAQDVQQFSQKLNTQQLREFTAVLTEVASGTRTAQGRLAGFTKSIRDGARGQSLLNDNLKQGVGDAEEFGKQVGIAARRLLAWAAPAQVIFNTVSRLRQAVNEIIEIDKQARRLIFFQNAGGIITKSAAALREISKEVPNQRKLAEALGSTSIELEGVFVATQKLQVSNSKIADQFTQIKSIAIAYGLSLRDTTAALLEISRVGQNVTKANSDVASGFTNAALSLIRVESGALGAAEAVRGLQAIQAQFFGGKAGAIFTQFADSADRAAAASQAAANAAGVLASASAGSSASVSELVDATTRLGSAFVNIQGLNFPQTIAIIGEAFTATGATTGRLATALRQTSTLIAQNASEIKELSGIEVTNPDGTIRDFTAILDVLKRIKDTAGTLESTELSLLIADRRNVADIQALAQSVVGLESAFNKFDDPVQRINSVMASALTLYDQTDAAVKSLEGQINNLNTAFTDLVNSAEVRTFLSGIVTGLTSGVGILKNFIANLQKAAPFLKSLGSISLFASFGFAAKVIINFTKGLLLSFLTAKKLSVEFQTISNEIRTGTNVARNLDTILESGLLTTQQVLSAQQQIGVFASRRLVLAQQLKTAEDALVTSIKSGTASQAQINILKENVNAILIQTQQLERDVLVTANQIADAAEREARAKAASQSRTLGRLGAVAAVGGAAAGIASQAGAPELGSAIGNAVGAGMAGAFIGSVVPVIGTTFGAVAGTLLSVGATLASKFSAAITGSAVEESAALLKKVEKASGAFGGNRDKGATRLLTETLDAQLRIQAVSEKVDQKGKDDLVRLEEKLVLLRQELALLTAAEKGNRLDKNDKRRLVQLKAAVGEGEAILAGVQQESDKRAEGLEILKEAKRILAENLRLTNLLKNSSDLTDRAKARKTIEENITKLKTSQFKELTLVKNAEELANIALEKRLEIIKKISDASVVRETFRDLLKSIPGTEKDKLALSIELDNQSFKDSLREADEIIKQIRGNTTSFEGPDGDAARAKIEEQEDNKRTAGLNRLKELFATQDKTLSNANKATENQIKSWESASKRVTKAFADVAKNQSRLADIFKTVGAANATILSRVGDAITGGLDAAGSSIASRFAAITQNAGKELSNIRDTFSSQQGTLGSRFGDLGQVQSSANRLIDIIGQQISESDEKLANARSGIVRTEAAESRELARAARADFESRIKETRREIEIRRTLLNSEIQSIQKRFDAERQLNELRRSQQEEFGRLLIESPEKFKETLDGIGTATNFFKGVTDINIDSLKTLQSRATQLRGQGPQGQEALRTILTGIQDAVKLGRPDIVSGVGNKQLEQVFLRVQRENTTSLSNDLKRQKDEANSQTKLQREIDARQKRLVELAQFDAALQQAQLAIAQSSVQLAIKQRDVQTGHLAGIEKNAETSSRNIALMLNALKPGATNAGNNPLVANVLEALNAINEQRGPGGFKGTGNESRDEIRKFLESVAKRFESDTDIAGRDSQATKVRAAARKKLTDAVELERKKLLEQVGTVNELTIAMNKAKLATEGATQATLKQTGFGTKKFTGGTDTGTLAQGLRGQLEQDKSGRFNRFIPKELAEIKAREKAGGQLTKLERNRVRELERQSRRGFFNDTRGGRKQARRILRDPGTLENVVGEFRKTLSDSSQNQNEFIDRARRLRGQGRRGERGIDVQQVQDFLTGAGFQGAANQVNTKGQAADVLDRFIEISKRLAKEQGKISSETKKRIVQVLGDELVVGLKDVTAAAKKAAIDEAKRKEKEKEEREAARASEMLKQVSQVSKAAAQSVFAEEGMRTLNQAIQAGFQEGGEAIKLAISTGAEELGETKVSINPIELQAEIQFKTPDALTAADLGALMREALVPIVADGDKLTLTAQNLTDLINVLVKKNIIPLPSLGRGVDSGIDR
jgi:hypothetical protein